jgi:hypothetical protein
MRLTSVLRRATYSVAAIRFDERNNPMKVGQNRILLYVVGAAIVSALSYVVWRLIAGYLTGWVDVPTCMQITIDSGVVDRAKSTEVVTKIINASRISKDERKPFDMIHVRGPDVSVTWAGPTNPMVSVCLLGSYDRWKSAVTYFESELQKSFVITNARVQLNPRNFPQRSPLVFDIARPIDFAQLEHSVFTNPATKK